MWLPPEAYFTVSRMAKVFGTLKPSSKDIGAYGLTITAPKQSTMLFDS
jgi:hypothetical protein